MMIRKLVIAAATVAALSPSLSNASVEKESAKACASAFVTSMASPGTAAPAYKMAYRGSTGSALDGFYNAADYSFTLEARDPKTGAAIARARCTTDTHGAVTEIASIPLKGGLSTLASTF